MKWGLEQNKNRRSKVEGDVQMKTHRGRDLGEFKAAGALMSGGMEAGEQCEVVAGFTARRLIQVALAHLMKNKMAQYLIQVALAHLMKMATCVCASTQSTKIALNHQEL
jgi:hypothetical protein